MSLDSTINVANDETAALKKSIDDITRQTGHGELTAAATNSLYGINHRGYGGVTQANTDLHGLTFFTRPRLNLSYDNVANSRILTPMLGGDDKTLQTAIRLLLDPKLASEGNVKSKLIDDKCAFIPVLSNNLISLSGWPDKAVDTYTSKEGMQKEAWSMVDGVYNDYTTYDITANFRNTAGDPITLLLNSWILYSSMVYQGRMVPYPEHIVLNEMDYTTRIYRLVLDQTQRYVQKIGCCGAAFPTAVPLGANFNFNNETPLNSENDQLSFNFRCIGAEYLDPILIDEFNKVVAIFNPLLAEDIDAVNAGRRIGPNGYLKLDHREKALYNFRGYPWINQDTYELEWWVETQTYIAIQPEKREEL